MSKINGSMLLASFPLLGALLILLSTMALILYVETMQQAFFTTMQTGILEQSIRVYLPNIQADIPTVSDCDSSPVIDGYSIKNDKHVVQVWLCDDIIMIEWQ